MQENNVFYRNDRVTFLLKNSAKNKFNGYKKKLEKPNMMNHLEILQLVDAYIDSREVYKKVNLQESKVYYDTIASQLKIIKELLYFQNTIKFI